MTGLKLMAARGRRRWGIAVAMLLIAVGASWSAGFLWFIHMTRQQATLVGKADGIVVLTGGADRVEAALQLLLEGQAHRLLISGIGGGADLAVLARRSAGDISPLAERITLGRTATSTRGNALETASWVSNNRIGTLIVVTAYYHMPRALAELRRALPGVTLLAAPVLTPGSTAHPDAARGPSTRLLAEEYSKYLIALTGLTAWLPAREPPQPGGHAG